MDNMTALASAFARAYHFRNNAVHVFADDLAEKLLTREEYDGISRNMSEGVAYFAPGFEGTPEEALRLIVERQPATSVWRGVPSENGRSATPLESAARRSSCTPAATTRLPCAPMTKRQTGR